MLIYFLAILISIDDWLALAWCSYLVALPLAEARRLRLFSRHLSGWITPRATSRTVSTELLVIDGKSIGWRLQK